MLSTSVRNAWALSLPQHLTFISCFSSVLQKQVISDDCFNFFHHPVSLDQISAHLSSNVSKYNLTLSSYVRSHNLGNFFFIAP